MAGKVITEEDRIGMFLANMPWFHVGDSVVEMLIDKGFFRQAASTKFHGAYDGGLFDHSFSVMMNLKKLTGRLDLEWQNPRSPYIVGMFHDLCKIDQYEKQANGIYKWVDTPIKGHGSKSVKILRTLIVPTEEEEACIMYHMGAFCDKNEWKCYTSAIHKFPNVLWTHTADMVASHLENT